MTTTTLLVNGTSSAGTVTYTGGASWTAVVADASDATYAEQTAGSVAVLNLGTLTLATGEVTKTAAVRARMRSVSSTSNVTVRLKKSATGEQVAVLNEAGVTTTIATYTGYAAPNTLTQAQINNLQLEVIPSASGANARFVELYVDLVTAVRPTVVLVNPTGTVTSSFPQFDWTYTQGSDGGPQSRFQVKLFTAAVIAGGGFDPDTSTAIYDSGEVVSSSTGLISTQMIQEGVNHGAYVKVAQTVNGSPQWSAWDSNTFTLDVTPPTIISVTRTVNTSTASVSVVVQRSGGGAAWTSADVQRSADSGTTWEFVRGASNAAASGTTFTVVDYEAPFDTTIMYRGRGTNTTGSVGSEISETSAWTNSSTGTLSPTRAWLKAIDSTLNLAVTMSEAPTFDSEWRHGAFQVLGRSAPVVVADVVTGRSGTLTLHTFTLAEAADVEELLRGTGPWLLQAPSSYGIDEGWFHVQSFTRRFLAPQVARIVDRLFEVSLLEVDRPPDTSSA